MTISFANADPFDAETGVDVNKIVTFELTSDDQPVDISSINIQMDPAGAALVDVVIGGNFEPGWMGAQSSIDPGPGPEDVTITIEYEFLPFADLEAIAVVVDADQDGGGAPFSDSFGFTTGTGVTPGITLADETPVNGATDVPIDSSIQFDIVSSGDDIDLNTLDVEVGGVPAIQGGSFEPGFSGMINPPTGAGLNTIDINPDSDFANGVAVGVDITFVDDQSMTGPYSFGFSFDTEAGAPGDTVTISDSAPADLETGVELDKTITLTLGHTDPIRTIDETTLNVTVDGNPAITGGAFEAGYDGAGSLLTPVAESLNIVIDPTAEYAPLTPLTVDVVSVDDDLAQTFNPGSFSFTTGDVPDVDPPEIDPTDPADGATDTNANPFRWQFNVTDPGTGVDQATINARIKRTADATFENAVVAGVVQAGWTGTITAIANGFAVDITRDARLDYETAYQWEIDAGDFA